jgi:hypothetical protein
VIRRADSGNLSIKPGKMAVMMPIALSGNPVFGTPATAM